MPDPTQTPPPTTTPSPVVAGGTTPPPTVERPPAPTDEVQRLSQQLADYKQRDEQSQMAATLESWVARRTGQLKAAGWSEDAAADYATQQGSAALARFQQQQLAQENTTLLKLITAQHIGAEFGVPPTQLLHGNSPDEMRRIAQEAQAGSAKIKELEARLARFEKGSVPTQTYDSGTGGAAMSDQEFELYASKYDGTWPEAVRKRVQEIHSRR